MRTIIHENKPMDLFLCRESCPICDTQDLEMLLSVPYSRKEIADVIVARYESNLSAEDLEGVSYELLFCKTCNFTFQKYVPTHEMVQKLYSYQSHDRIAESLKKRAASQVKYYFRNARMAEKALLLLGGTSSGLSAFEYGAGWGYFSLMLKAFGLRVTALEVSNERTENLRSLGIPVVSRAEDLEGTYDYAHADQVFEHLADPKSAIREVGSHIRSGGVAYVAVPNGNTVRHRIRNGSGNYFIKDVYPLEHVNCFSHTALVALAAHAGLTPVPFSKALPRFLKYASLRDNAHFVQEAAKFLFTQKNGTALYFTAA